MDRIDLMRTYLSVADTGSFVGAAQRQRITPQLASKYVRALEDELGVQLFNRSTRKVSMTETGAAFYNRCLRLIEEFDELKADVQQDQRSPRGELRLTAPHCFGGKYLVDALGDFSNLYPEVSVNLDLTDRYIDLVEDGIDVAIRIGQLEDSSLIAKQIGIAQVIACASPTFLNTVAPIEVPEDLKHYPCIIDTNFKVKDQWPFVNKGKQTKVGVTGQLKVNSASAARKLALNHKGIFLTLRYMVDDDFASGKLRQILPNFSPLTIPINAVYPPTRHLSAKVRLFIDFASERFSWMR